MSAANQIFLVMDAGSPVTAVTSKHGMRAFLKSRLDMFVNPLVYRFAGDGYSPIIMAQALSE
jgi:hypothetical protein